MKLYKFVSFKKKYWDDPLKTNSLYLSTTTEVANPNDPTEFIHTWDSDSSYFEYSGLLLKHSYQSLFSKTRVLCLTQTFSDYCWREFAESHGVCYEFDFNPAQKAIDLTCDFVQYADYKEHNVPTYIIRQASPPQIQDQLMRNDLTLSEVYRLQISIESNLKELFLRHIIEEISLKKLSQFYQEREFRFLHVESGTPGTKIITRMPKGKITFFELGLNLVKIHTSDIAKVLAVRNDIEVVRADFS